MREALIDPAEYAQRGYPHALWRRLRREAPVTLVDMAFSEAYLVTRYDDVVTVAKDDRFSRDIQPLVRWLPGLVRVPLTRHMLSQDPPDHTRLRKLVSQAFTPRRIERLRDRVDDPAKRWKFRMGDLETRKSWSKYVAAYEDALSRTSTADAPWYVIPADKKWYRDWAVATIMVEVLESMDLTWPGPAADLTGIDLRGATIGDEVDLSDAVLIGAQLDDAIVLGKMTGADLTNASLTNADLSGTDLTNATVTGATLTGAQVNATLFDTNDLAAATMTHVTVGIRSGETLAGVDLSGFDLTGVSFSSRASGPISMSAARFTGATLTGASFLRVDLTAADFTDAVFAVEGGVEPSFTETRCPDFLPSDDTVKGRAGCRL